MSRDRQPVRINVADLQQFGDGLGAMIIGRLYDNGTAFSTIHEVDGSIQHFFHVTRKRLSS